ncbi:hypothetical protein ACFVXE_29320 [Streptomyces sp. NPDC058231]|uniref:hypothetical protein n=1 Tax=Streptomyces sp. NPDC058231 TaxID=3346392 RepID=UPI0036ED39E1
MSETIDEGGPFTSRFGTGRLLFLVAEHTPTGRIVGISSSIPPLSVLGGMEHHGAAPAALAWADLYVCWALTESREEAMALESRVLAVPGVGWWNRAR